jgi:P-type Cu+ transporter
VAIAIGSGSDVALSSASFVLVSSDLGGILTLVDLSATVFRRVKLNFVRVYTKRCPAGMANFKGLAVGSGIQYRGNPDRGRCPILRQAHPARSSLGFPCHGVVVSEIGRCPISPSLTLDTSQFGFSRL